MSQLMHYCIQGGWLVVGTDNPEAGAAYMRKHLLRGSAEVPPFIVRKVRLDHAKVVPALEYLVQP